MKNLKKIILFLLIFTFVFSCSLNIFAADETTSGEQTKPVCTHSWLTKTIPANCQHPEQVLVYCVLCGEENKIININETLGEHTYTEKITNNIKIKTCTICGDVVAEVIEEEKPKDPEVPEIPKFESKEYTFIFEDKIYTIKTTSEFECIMKSDDASTETKYNYVITNNIFALVDSGNKVLRTFTINADNSLTEVNKDTGLTKDDLKDILEAIKTQINFNNISEDDFNNLKNNVDSLKDIINNLVDELSKEKQDIDWKTVLKLVLTLVGLVSIIVIALLIALLRTKLITVRNSRIYEKTKQATDEMFAGYQKTVVDMIDKLGEKVSNKIDESEENRKKEAEAESLKLKAEIETAKKNLLISNVLDESK